MVNSDRYELDQIFPMNPSVFKISISVESYVERYDEKTAENNRNCYVAEKRIVCKLLRISIPNSDSANQSFGQIVIYSPLNDTNYFPVF